MISDTGAARRARSVAARVPYLLDHLVACVLAVSGAALGLILTALVCIAFGDVVLRYLFGGGWAWSGTVSTVLLLWLAWIGAGHLWLADGHIAVTLTGARARRWLMRLFGLVVIGGGLILVPMALRTMEAYSFIDLPVLGWTASVKYLPVAVGTGYLVAAAALAMLAGLARYSKERA